MFFTCILKLQEPGLERVFIIAKNRLIICKTFYNFNIHIYIFLLLLDIVPLFNLFKPASDFLGLSEVIINLISSTISLRH